MTRLLKILITLDQLCGEIRATVTRYEHEVLK